MTPYSALAGGRLSKHPGETSKRLEEDSYAKFKYDATAEQDAVIISRVAELAEKRGVSMTEISLAWLLTKGNVPGSGRHQAASYRGRGQGGGAYTLTPEECRLSGRALCSAQTGRRYGPEHTCGRKRTARLVHRQSDNRKSIRRMSG